MVADERWLGSDVVMAKAMKMKLVMQMNIGLGIGLSVRMDEVGKSAGSCSSALSR